MIQLAVRYSIVFLLLFSNSLGLLAQVDSTTSRNAEKKQALEEYKQSLKKPHQDMLFVDFNWDYLLNMPGFVKQKWYGRGINVAFLYDYPLNQNGNFSVALGAGFQSHNYYLNSISTTYDSAGASHTRWQRVDGTVMDRGKISINYIDVPFEIRLRTDPNKFDQRWKFAIGAKVGYLINVHEKRIDNDNMKIKLYDYPTVSLFRYGVNARFQYGAVGLSAFYSITPFHESKFTMSDQNTLTIGLTLVPF